MAFLLAQCASFLEELATTFTSSSSLLVLLVAGWSSLPLWSMW